MPKLSSDCTGFDIIEELGEEMDIVDDPLSVGWRCFLSRGARERLLSDRSREEVLELTGDEANWIYEKDGEEYVRVIDNVSIPFHIHFRIAGELFGDDGEPTDEIIVYREVDKPKSH